MKRARTVGAGRSRTIPGLQEKATIILGFYGETAHLDRGYVGRVVLNILEDLVAMKTGGN